MDVSVVKYYPSASVVKYTIEVLVWLSTIRVPVWPSILFKCQCGQVLSKCQFGQVCGHYSSSDSCASPSRERHRYSRARWALVLTHSLTWGGEQHFFLRLHSSSGIDNEIDTRLRCSFMRLSSRYLFRLNTVQWTVSIQICLTIDKARKLRNVWTEMHT